MSNMLKAEHQRRKKQPLSGHCLGVTPSFVLLPHITLFHTFLLATRFDVGALRTQRHPLALPRRIAGASLVIMPRRVILSRPSAPSSGSWLREGNKDHVVPKETVARCPRHFGWWGSTFSFCMVQFLEGSWLRGTWPRVRITMSSTQLVVPSSMRVPGSVSITGRDCFKQVNYITY